MVYTVHTPEYSDMDISFFYTTMAIGIFTLGFALGTLLENRKIRWLRLDELFDSVVTGRVALENRVDRIEEEVRHIRKEVEYMYVDPDTTQTLREVSGE